MSDVETALPQLCETCCLRAELIALTDELMISAVHGMNLQTDVIDRLPPWRAKLVVTVCLAAGGTLQHGTPDVFAAAVDKAGMRDAAATGWWRQALGMPARELYVPPPVSDYRPPTGWTVVDNPAKKANNPHR